MTKNILLALGMLAALQSFAENWPQFRGPTGQGICSETGVPLTWSTNSHVAWKTPIPGEAWSSPIVWADRVFVTTPANEGKSLHLLALDTTTGNILWNKEVLQQDPIRKDDGNSWATSTPATDGQRVYVVSFNGTFAAVNFDGALAWTNLSTAFYLKHGLASSLMLHGDFVVMNCDGTSKGGPDPYLGWQKAWDGSYVLALDRNTGQVKWKTPRGLSRVAFSTPIYHQFEGRDLVLSAAGDVVQGFDLNTGERVWTATNRGEGLVPTPVTGDGLVFSPSSFNTGTPDIPEAIRAFRLGGKGDVSKTHFVWEQTQNVPKIPSLLYAKPYLYSLAESGMLQCLKAVTGEIVWKQRLPAGQYGASPLLAENRIYLLSDKGETTVIEVGPEYKVLAKNQLGEKCKASLAVSNGKLFIRSQSNLFCITR